ncbi:G-PROTEIN-RECEP-F1-2 domain-containing protein [Aphelenchoides bicaudatus]|nr:G-PROTEIN-RECEP-F1-2 domain-containing protein [Aphelenchoides bicaudatus]
MDSTTAIGVTYAVLGALGVICNLATALMIITRRVFRLSAYTIMANIAFCDAIMAFVAGVFCGGLILLGVPPEFNAFNQLNNNDSMLLSFNQSLTLNSTKMTSDFDSLSNETLKRITRSMLSTTEKRSPAHGHQGASPDQPRFTIDETLVSWKGERSNDQLLDAFIRAGLENQRMNLQNEYNT